MGSGSGVFNTSCTKQTATVTQNSTTGAVTATWSGSGTFFIGIKYSTGNVVGESIPTSGEVWTYVYSSTLDGTAVTGSTSNLKLTSK
jgi:hypothetical protein